MYFEVTMEVVHPRFVFLRAISYVAWVWICVMCEPEFWKLARNIMMHTSIHSPLLPFMRPMFSIQCTAGKRLEHRLSAYKGGWFHVLPGSNHLLFTASRFYTFSNLYCELPLSSTPTFFSLFSIIHPTNSSMYLF